MSTKHFILGAALGIGLLAGNPLTAYAQRGGHGGGGGGGRGAHVGGGFGMNSHAAFAHGGNFVTLHNGAFAHANVNQFFAHTNVNHLFDHGRFDGRGHQFGFFPGFAFGPWWYGGYGYGGPAYFDPYLAAYYDPYFYASQPYVYSGMVHGGPNYSYGGAVTTRASNPRLASSAEVNVILPVADAQVWVDGKRMASTPSTERSFVTNSVPDGQSRVYHVTASWMENGQEVKSEHSVTVTAGGKFTANFTAVHTARQ